MDGKFFGKISKSIKEHNQTKHVISNCDHLKFSYSVTYAVDLFVYQLISMVLAYMDGFINSWFDAAETFDEPQSS